MIYANTQGDPGVVYLDTFEGDVKAAASALDHHDLSAEEMSTLLHAERNDFFPGVGGWGPASLSL